MDALITRFLAHVRLRARSEHWPIYEDLAWGLEASLSSRRRPTAALKPRDLHSFLAYGYLRHHQPITARSARRFCAAARVFVHWWMGQEGERPGGLFPRQIKVVARAVTRAARASELLDTLQRRGCAEPATAQVDDYFEIVVRSGSHLVVRPLGSRALVGPVFVTEQLAATLDPGAFVNLRLARQEGRWHILDSGSCYPPSARAALVESRAVGWSP